MRNFQRKIKHIFYRFTMRPQRILMKIKNFYSKSCIFYEKYAKILPKSKYFSPQKLAATTKRNHQNVR